jgi:hypothetical protein
MLQYNIINRDDETLEMNDKEFPSAVFKYFNSQNIQSTYNLSGR